jgi:DNA mismatch endonuclease, patch repair protein
MADVHNKETRSFNMSQIKSKNTKPEILVRKFLYSQSFRFRLHGKNLPGKPDIILSKYKTVIFVHGCFWHGHQNCKYFTLPKSRTDWWANKIARNIQNDQRTLIAIRSQGWNIILLWECQLKPKTIQNTFISLLLELKTFQKNKRNSNRIKCSN